jgi:hypothetical protein
LKRGGEIPSVAWRPVWSSSAHEKALSVYRLPGEAHGFVLPLTQPFYGPAVTSLAHFLPLAASAATNIVLRGGATGSPPKPTSLPAELWPLQIFFGLLLVFGVIGLCFPRAIWWLKVGWLFRAAPEPLGFWLFITRVAGLVLVACAAAVLLRMNGVTLPNLK